MTNAVLSTVSVSAQQYERDHVMGISWWYCSSRTRNKFVTNIQAARVVSSKMVDAVSKRQFYIDHFVPPQNSQEATRNNATKRKIVDVNLAYLMHEPPHARRAAEYSKNFLSS